MLDRDQSGNRIHELEAKLEDNLTKPKKRQIQFQTERYKLKKRIEEMTSENRDLAADIYKLRVQIEKIYLGKAT